VQVLVAPGKLLHIAIGFVSQPPLLTKHSLMSTQPFTPTPVPL
jgi:hypothetical protein